jgi:hypothetical protein
MKIAIAGVLGALLLVGCESTPIVITKEVKVPVAVPCVNSADVPPVREMVTESLHRDDPVFRKVQATLVDLKGLQQDDLRLRAILEGCVGD